MRRTMYMHTIGGAPARFDPLFRIIHRVPIGSEWRVTLAADRDQIMRERKQSRANLRKEGRIGRVTYGFVLVEVS